MGVDGMVNLDDFEVGTFSFHGPLVQKAGDGSISAKWSSKLIRWMRRKQKLARTILSPAALAYYESGSDDEWSKSPLQFSFSSSSSSPRASQSIPRSPPHPFSHIAALHENNNAYRRIRFRPRVLRKVKEVDTSTEILGVKSTVPFFIAPAALAKLGHPDGEVNLTKGA